MAGFVKQIVRIGLVGAVATGGIIAVAAIADQPRMKAAISQAKTNFNKQIDRNISDPIALRTAIRELAGEYPERIAEVRGELAEIRRQNEQLASTLNESMRVVALADADLAKLDNAIAQAEGTTIENVAYTGRSTRVVILFKNERLDVEQAYGKRNQIAAIRNAHVNRVEDVRREAGYLDKQERQFANLLGKLETEHAELQTQLFDLDRQVDAIARNQEMIKTLERLEERFHDKSRYTVANVDHLHARLTELRAETEQRLAMLSGSDAENSYLNKARTEMAREAELETGPTLLPLTPLIEETVEIDTNDMTSNSPLANNVD